MLNKRILAWCSLWNSDFSLALATRNTVVPLLRKTYVSPSRHVPTSRHETTNKYYFSCQRKRFHRSISRCFLFLSLSERSHTSLTYDYLAYLFQLKLNRNLFLAATYMPLSARWSYILIRDIAYDFSVINFVICKIAKQTLYVLNDTFRYFRKCENLTTRRIYIIANLARKYTSL